MSRVETPVSLPTAEDAFSELDGIFAQGWIEWLDDAAPGHLQKPEETLPEWHYRVSLKEKKDDERLKLARKLLPGDTFVYVRSEVGTNQFSAIEYQCEHVDQGPQPMVTGFSPEHGRIRLYPDTWVLVKPSLTHQIAELGVNTALALLEPQRNHQPADSSR